MHLVTISWTISVTRNDNLKVKVQKVYATQV